MAPAGVNQGDSLQSRLSGLSRLGPRAAAFGLSLCLFVAWSLTAKASPQDFPSTYVGESVDGTLRREAEKDLLLETSSGKVLRFRLLAKTEFRTKDGKPMRDSLFHAGDRIAVEVNPDDVETAVYVILVRSGSSSERESAAAVVEEARITAPDSGDFGRSTDSRADGTAMSGNRSAPRDESMDAVVGDARSGALSSSADLPEFLVEKVTTHYAGTRRGDKWRAENVVTAELSVGPGGKEDYRTLKVNGRPVDPSQETGSRTSGEFGSMSLILSPRTAAVFTQHGQERIATRAAWVFDFSVGQPQSEWTLDLDGRKYKTAYQGTIWIDKETRQVLRTESHAVGIPGNSSADRVESSLEYGFVNLAGRQYPMPVRSVSEACSRNTPDCIRDVTEFRNYRAESQDAGGAAVAQPSPGVPVVTANPGNDVEGRCAALADRALDQMQNPPAAWVDPVSEARSQIQSEGLNAYIRANGGARGLLASTRRDLQVSKGRKDAYGVNLNQAWIDMLVCMPR
jgi:hypothetical protein